MQLQYLSQEAIDDIKINFSKYKGHFQDSTNQWFMKVFEENNWLKDTKITFNPIEFDMSPDYNLSDRRNIENAYEALGSLSPALASDERIWAGLLFGPCWSYVQYRRKEELSSGIEQDIKNSYFFMRGIKRSCFMNCLSRLWWTGYILYDSSSKDHYKAADLVCDSAFASTILLFSSSNFTARKEIALGVLDCLGARKAKGEKIGRYHYVEANRYLNSLGGAMLLDMFTREEVCELTEKHLKKYFSPNPGQ